MPARLAGHFEPAEHQFRPNPGYQLRPLATLGPSERRVLGPDPAGNEVAGLLVSAGSGGLPLRAVGPGVAAWFERDQALDGRRLLDELAASDAAEQVVGLVLDGVLEVSSPQGFQTQSRAMPTVLGDLALDAPAGALADLSRAALRHAGRLDIGDSRALAARLYFYNRVPLTPNRWRTWPDAGAVLEHLGCAAGLGLPGGFVTVDAAREDWIIWRRPRTAGADVSPSAGRYKLYVSPQVDDLRAAFDAVVAHLAISEAVALKVGSSAPGLLRPDKLVAYFDDKAGAVALAQSMANDVSRLRPHGVPFTAPLDRRGLLSWGLDPDNAGGSADGGAAASWRISICNRLAGAIVAARAEGAEAADACRFALARAWYGGIDTRSWSPRGTAA